MEELRWSMRFPVRAFTRLDCNGYGFVYGMTREMSFEGLFLETRGRLPRSQKYTFATVKHPDRQVRRGMGDLIIPARVARVSDTGLALLFEEYGDAVLEGLAMLMGNAAMAPGRRRAAVH
ncbi:MAG TPA: hypothetical protein VKA13_04275 [Gammaproteobacteria bacterium]|nr:hypothetical protein [Gammaproteobacteria bacterium]